MQENNKIQEISINIPNDDEKKYSDSDVDKIIHKKFARWKKEEEKKIEEEKAKVIKQFDKESFSKELLERERKVTERELRAEAIERLSVKGIPKIVANLLKYENKESFEKSYTLLLKTLQPMVDAGIKKVLKGNTPKTSKVISSSKIDIGNK